jgi:hypothetical protein
LYEENKAVLDLATMDAFAQSYTDIEPQAEDDAMATSGRPVSSPSLEQGIDILSDEIAGQCRFV